DYAQALDRFKRAETRLQKWASRVQHIEARLAHVRQALHQSTRPGKPGQPREIAPPTTLPPVSMEGPQQEEEMLEAELQAEATEPAKVLPDDTQQQEEMLTEELQVGATPPSAVP